VVEFLNLCFQRSALCNQEIEPDHAEVD
jgi:hypothetical protein